MPEDAAAHEKPADDPVSGESVPPFRGGAQPTGDLDLLVALDEPEQLIRELKRLAGERGRDQRWDGIVKMCERAEEYFEHLNRPKANRPQA